MSIVRHIPASRRNAIKSGPGLVLLTLIASVVQFSANCVLAGGITIVRSDYDKSDYVLVATTIKTANSDFSNTRADSEFNTNLSGVQGTASTTVNIGRGVTLPNPAIYYAITGISIEEYFNKPCEMKLFGRLIDPRFQSDTRELARFTIGRCTAATNYAMVNVAEEIPENFVYSDQGQDKHFISSIRVCNGNKLVLPQLAYSHIVWKIKGLKAQGSVVSLVDSVTLKAEVGPHNSKTSSFARTNCLDITQDSYVKPGWKSWHECPAGQIATGVTAYHHDDKWLTGLALNCQSVWARNVATPPVTDLHGY